MSVSSDVLAQSERVFANPFQIEDLQVFDCDTLHSILEHDNTGVLCKYLAHSLQDKAASLVQHISRCLPEQQQALFAQELRQKLQPQDIDQARQAVLNGFFWELIYWKTPELYEELTEGERLHPGIFQSLEAHLRGKVVLDAGAGSGRASFECLRYGAAQVYAIEPSPGLLRLLRNKIDARHAQEQVVPREGRFDCLPLPDKSVDITISCSAFTAADEQGGQPGLAEMKRVTRPGGKIVIIWPRSEDHTWFEKQGFQYVSLPTFEEMAVHFRSLQTAFHCARLFYAHNHDVLHYLSETQEPDVPFSIIGTNPPRDYFWLEVNERNI